jgi:transposase-like protein
VAKEQARKYAKYTEEFRRQAVERMQDCKSIRGLARELGINHHLLYEWRERMADLSDQRATGKKKIRQQENELNELKRLLAEKTLEVDFFKGALQKIAVRRQPHNESGAAVSTTKSGK